MVSRRDVMGTTAALAGASLLLARARAAQANQADATGQAWARSYSGTTLPPQPPGEPGRDYAPTITPGGATLPFKIVDGVKICWRPTFGERCPSTRLTRSAA